jgi:hypothetical protein
MSNAATQAVEAMRQMKVCKQVWGTGNQSHVPMWTHVITGTVIADCEDTAPWVDVHTSYVSNYLEGDDYVKGPHNTYEEVEYGHIASVDEVFATINGELKRRGWTVLDSEGNVVA